MYQFHISVLRFLALFSNYFFEKELFCFSKTFSKQIFSSYRNIFSDFLSYGNSFFYFSSYRNIFSDFLSYGNSFFLLFILWQPKIKAQKYEIGTPHIKGISLRSRLCCIFYLYALHVSPLLN